MRIHDASSLPSRVPARVQQATRRNNRQEFEISSLLCIAYGPYNKDYQKRITSLWEVALNYVLEFIQANKKETVHPYRKRRRSQYNSHTQ